jgi:Methylamine utilisation protein MauE
MMDLSAFAADPIAVGTIVGALALVMFAAAWHKLREPDVFSGSLAAYRLLPQALVEPVARLLPIVEGVLGVGILVPATRPTALLLVAGLVLIYGVAMAVNLLRGRHDIDCGCGGATHPLSWGLVGRNIVLAAAALIASRPTLERGMDWIDALTLVLGVLAFYALYLMADELLRQASRLAQMKRAEQD